MIAWHELTQTAAFTRLDRRFGDLLHRLDTSTHSDLVALTGALLSHVRTRGHSCLSLQEHAAKSFITDSKFSTPRLPDKEAWIASLEASELCGDGSTLTPLVLDGRERVYLFRHWSAEQRLANQVRERVAQSIPDQGLLEIKPSLASLFANDGADIGEVDWQEAAAIAAVRSRITVITGGPGTGKTTTVVRLLALCLHLEPGLRIALAAPTGKAAARLGESIQSQKRSLPIDQELRERIPEEVSTLHRLLGYRPFDDSFRHGPKSPLPYDLCIIDEASMIDLGMMAVLFEAAGPETRIVLLGDPDQLASVDTGYVLGDLCAAATSREGHSKELAETYMQLTGKDLPLAKSPTLLSDAVVCLRKNYRFASHPGIGTLSEAVRIGDADSALAVLLDAAHPDVLLANATEDASRAITAIMPRLDSVVTAPDLETALDRFGHAQILCGIKRGTHGVEGYNAAVERALADKKHSVSDTFYRGRPIMVTANDYATQLYNGDIGICWPDADGTTFVWFPSDDAARAVSLARLPAHETAWAMTVHKSQGSEFGEVLLVMPQSDHPLCSRELLYTGITRARTQVTVVASKTAIKTAVTDSAQRHGGLVEAILNSGA